MRTIAFCAAGYLAGGFLSIALATYFFMHSFGNGEMIYWFCIGGLIGGIPSAALGRVLDERSRNRTAAGAVPPPITADAPIPTEVATAPAPIAKSKFRRNAHWLSAAFLVALLAATIFLIDHYSPGNRLDRAMKPFVDANIELLVAYSGKVDELDRAGDAETLIAAYELVRHQGLLAAREELGDKAYDASYSLEHPMIASSLRAQRRIIGEFKRRSPGERAQNLARCLERIADKRVGTWDRQTVFKTSYELAASGSDRAKSYRPGEQGVILLDDLLRMKPIAIELQAVMDGAVTTSSSNGQALGSARYGLKGKDYLQFYYPGALPRVQKLCEQHLTPPVRERLAAAQKEWELEPTITP
jgi:hypothetical protein